MNVEEMRGGYTTGSCATAGMKAGLLALLTKDFVDNVQIENPQGEFIEVPIKHIEVLSENSVTVTVMKDGGDDPDVTHGTDIVTTVELDDSKQLQFNAGIGVGTITKQGMALPPGEPAINPGPRAMMKIVYEELVEPLGKGAIVTVSVPEGERLARKTLNATLGIIGGISIIGTTGIVKPMSEEGFKHSLIPQLRVMKANGANVAVLVPGRIGQDLAEKSFGIDKAQMAETSNFMGFMLEQSVKAGFDKILVIGHIGKIIKLASGSFHTHNRMSDGRIETIVAYAALEGASQTVAAELMDCITTEAAMPILAREHLEGVYKRVAERAGMRSKRYIAGEADVGIVIATLDGKILATNEVAVKLGELEGWNIPSI